MTTESIASLQETVDTLTAALAVARERLTRAKIAACGVSIGDVVKSKGKYFRVCEIDVSFSTPWLKGNPQLKDGSWGLSMRNVFGEWQRVERK